jgi:hypothetical protein
MQVVSAVSLATKMFLTPPHAASVAERNAVFSGACVLQLCC